MDPSLEKELEQLKQDYKTNFHIGRPSREQSSRMKRIRDIENPPPPGPPPLPPIPPPPEEGVPLPELDPSPKCTACGDFCRGYKNVQGLCKICEDLQEARKIIIEEDKFLRRGNSDAKAELSLKTRALSLSNVHVQIPVHLDFFNEVQRKPEEIVATVRTWMDERNKRNLPLTLSSFAVALGVAKQTVLSYEEREEFAPIIRMVRTLCEMSTEDRLTNKDFATAGVIFSLMNNFGWSNKNYNGNVGESTQEVRITISKE